MVVLGRQRSPSSVNYFFTATFTSVYAGPCDKTAWVVELIELRMVNRLKKLRILVKCHRLEIQSVAEVLLRI
jgi:hypothetical protein